MADDEEVPQAEAEALRLKTLAEQKYNSGNLKSALKYAKRAHNLKSAADGVSEMLSAFEILHTATVPSVTPSTSASGGDGAATTTTSPLPDYYKILQIERFSHINTIKKQYKKLALTLHPDKNPFVASEEAFKLVGEAFTVLSDKIRRKEYDVKLRIAMQSAVLMAEEEEAEMTTFWTACSTCRLLHQFERKYLGHNLMCPSCNESFEAIEVEENGENVGLMETRVSARINARKKGNLGFSTNGELVGKRKIRKVDEIDTGTKVVRPKKAVEVTNVGMKGDVESDDELIEVLRSRNKGKVKHVGEGEEETMTLAEMQLLMKKKVNKEKVAVKEKEENEKAMKFNKTEKESKKRKEMNLSLIEDEDEDEAEMEALIARVREKRMNKEKVGVKEKGEEKEENEKTMKFNITEEDEAEVEMLIARVRDKRVNKEKVALKEKGEEKEENEMAPKFNLREKESEKIKETNLSLIEDEDEAEIETEALISRLRPKRGNKEKMAVKEKGEEKEENERVTKFNLREKESEKRKEMNLSLVEEENDADMETLIARVREKRANKEKVAVKEKENENVMKFNLTEKESEKGKEKNLSLIEEEDERETDTLIARVREKRVRRGALKGGDMDEGGRRRDLSIKRGGKGSNPDDLDLMALKSFDHYNFDNDRVERSFKKGQVWAVYDDDGMPRDYALIDDVISVHPFEVRLNRLEFQRNSDEALVHWGNMGFHISCGKFKVSRQVLVKSLKKFSHVIPCERAARELYRIYPSKGSIWALYKENDLGAGSRKQWYDIVVSLSNYTDTHGVSIAYLEKVDGLRTVFKRREVGAHAVRLLGKDELRLFSHRIPARKLSDEEASNLTKDCWELDPASLPRDC